MTAAKCFRNLKACLAERLAPVGFAAEGDLLLLKVDEALIVLEFQKDAKCSTKLEIRFTLNVGISIDALRLAVATEFEGAFAKTPSPERCHWRERLGRLLQAEKDVWWLVHDELTAQSACREIADGILNTALPKVNASASSEALVRLWQEGRGQGLTEYERRANLARLLIALGRKEQAQLAVQSLEEASLGKSWEASARYDAKELRKQLA